MSLKDKVPECRGQTRLGHWRQAVDWAGLGGVPLLGDTRLLSWVAHRLDPESAEFWAMVYLGEADGMVAGLTQNFPETIRPVLRIVPMKEGASRVAGIFLVIANDELYFFADPTVNIDPTAEELADIAIGCADEARRLLAAYQDAEDLLRVGAYAPGSNAEIDRAVAVNDALKAFGVSP